MFPYWVLFSIFALGSLESGRERHQHARGGVLLVAALMALALVVGLRYDVGADWETYERLYDYTAGLSFAEALAFGDPGYSLLSWASAELGAGVWLLNLLCALIFTWGLMKFVRLQPNPWLAVTVAVPYLVVVVAMGYTRQGAAIGLILAALAAFETRKVVRFLVLITVAATFHKTAVIVVPLAALAVTKNKVLVGGLVLLTGLGLYYALLASSVERLMLNYVEAEYESQGAAIRVAMNLLPAVIYLLFQRRFADHEVQRKVWRNFAIAALATLPMLFLLDSSTAVDRIALYAIPLQLYVYSRVPWAFASQGRQNGQLVLVVTVYAALVMFVWLNFAAHSEYWLPYQFYPFVDPGY